MKPRAINAAVDARQMPVPALAPREASLRGQKTGRKKGRGFYRLLFVPCVTGYPVRMSSSPESAFPGWLLPTVQRMFTGCTPARQRLRTSQLRDVIPRDQHAAPDGTCESSAPIVLTCSKPTLPPITFGTPVWRIEVKERADSRSGLRILIRKRWHAELIPIKRLLAVGGKKNGRCR